jgi:hypothetical protein
MALIDNEEAARRLARVILSDIELYQKKRIEAGDDMSGDLAEGRALFQRRVAPQLLPIFDATLATRRLGGRAANMPIPVMPVAAPPVPVVAPTPPEASTAPSPLPPPEPPPAEPAPSVAESPVSTAEVAVTAPAVESEMSQAETGRSVVTAEIAQSMMAEGSGGGEAAPVPEASPPALAAAAAEPEAKLATDDRATPVPVEDIVSRPSVAREELPARPAADRASDGPPEPARDEPAAPEPPGDAPEEDRITARGMAVFTEAEAEPIKLPAPPAVATPPAPIPTPPRIPVAARGGTPRPVLLAQRPAEGAKESPAKTPQPLSPPTISPGQSSAGVRVGTPAGSPRVATPFRSSAFQPLNLPPMTEPAAVAPAGASAPAESPAAAPDDVVNLRKKTPKVVVLLVILAVIGGVMLIGRFLTRFI